MSGTRKSIRLKGYDYAQQGAYYVTICANERKCVFGDVINGEMVFNEAGKMVEFTWLDLPEHNNNIELDEFIVMPNHVHGIIVIVGAGSKPALIQERAGYEPAPTEHGLSEIIRQFKTFSAKRINQKNDTTGTRLWQRNFYEHVIRTDSDLARIRDYIEHNPAQWEEDEYYFEKA
jgi:REP element-mobilizing transposase RayT